MKFSALTLMFCLLAIGSFAQTNNNYIRLSEKITTESKDFTGFDQIDVSEDFVVYIKVSDEEEKIEIEANQNLHDLIQVEKDGSTLRINTKSYSTSGSNVKEHLVAYLTVKDLTKIEGEEDVVFILKDKLATDNLIINLDEDCTLEGHIEVQNLEVVLDEDSVLEIEGSAQTMKVESNEDSSFKGLDFVVEDLEIDLFEGSTAKLTVNGDIDLRAREDSAFKYRGSGTFVRKKVDEDSEVKSW